MGQGSSDRTPGILLVTAQRDDRRTLFNALDGGGFRNVYTARDPDQARTVLAETPQLDIVMIECVGQAPVARAFCHDMHERPEYAHVRMIGMRPADAEPWVVDTDSPQVTAWLSTPVNAANVLPAVHAILKLPEPAAAPTPMPPLAVPERTSPPADYRFAFEGDEREWIISTPAGMVLEVNPAFVRHTGLDAEGVRGRSLAALLGEVEHVPDPFADPPGSGGMLERIVRRPRADGRKDLMRAVTQSVLRDGQTVHATSLRDHGALAHARAMLNLLARLQLPASGETGMREAVYLLMSALPLDFVGVYAALHESRGGPEARVQEFREPLGTGDDVPDVLRQPALRLVLDGDTLLHSTDAHSLAGADRFISAMQFAAFVGLPLVDDRKNVLGALLAGSRLPWDSSALVPETLHAAMARFAFDMRLERAHQRGRDRGLLDGLTHLPNRLLFNDRLETALQEAHRTGEMFAVLFVDMDRFKSINDSLGHSVGDKVLLVVAERLRESVRASDTVARYAGDEFTLIVRHVAQREAVLHIAEKIVHRMDEPLVLDDGSELHITTSIGISFYPEDATSADHLLKHADMAMYSAKGQGRNGYQVYVAMPDELHRQRVALESRLRQAEQNGELTLYYQPEVDVAGEDIVGMEALLRWEHPDLGMIRPGFFIPLAEETGLIISIGEWVLHTACRTAAEWRQRHDLALRVGVNLSARQLLQANLPDVVRSALSASGLPADDLELEIAESVGIEPTAALTDNLQALRDIGCRLAIDDFGLGNAAPDDLRTLPADRIKIDQSFVRNIGIKSDDEAVIETTIEAAHRLYRSVLAEGVETEDQLEFLRARDCDEAQGYLFCRPLTSEAFETLLAERRRLLARADGTASA